MSKSQNLKLLLILFIVTFAIVFPVQAQIIGDWSFKNGIVPCGIGSNMVIGSDGKAIPNPAFVPCTVCHFYKLLQNIINFLLFTSSALIVLMTTYIAFLFLLSGGSPKKIEDAKNKLWLLLWGIVWVLGSWLVLNTVINFITVIGKPGDFPTPWNQISCEISQSSSETNSEVDRLDDGVYEDGVDTSTAGYQSLDEETDGLEQVDPAAPYTTIDPISPIVKQEVQQASDIGGVNPNLVKAIIQAESSGNSNAVHLDKDGQYSYGLMQVRSDTAKNYDPALRGLTNEQIGERLKDPDYNIKIGTAYLNDLAAKYSGDLDKVIAAYNGGPGANGPSRDCPGSLRWQCQFDNPAHTITNTGYAVTRNYVVKVNQYYSQINR